MNWRRLFPIIFLFSCVDGFIINWLYPARLPFLFKDIFILIVYIIFFITRGPGRNWLFEFKVGIGRGSWYLAMSLILLGLFQIFNPGVPRLEVGVLGFKVMFFYWPLAILAYAYVDSLDCLRRLLKVIVYFSIPICIFGIYQFWQGPDFMVNTFGQGFKRAIILAAGSARTGAFLRVFGTFASTGQFTHFLVINTMFILGLLFTTRNKLEKSMMSGCLALNYLTILATGSRAGFILLFLTAFLFVIFCRWLWRAFFIALLLSISLNFGFNYLGRSVVGRFETVKDAGMIKSRTMDTTASLFKKYLDEYPFGKGMGTASGASRHLLKERPSELEFIENYLAKLQCEVGILGVILFYLLLLSLLTHWFRHWFKFIDQRTYVFIAALTSYCWVMFGVSLFGLIDTPPISLFLWTEVGIVAKLATFPSYDQYPVST